VDYLGASVAASTISMSELRQIAQMHLRVRASTTADMIFFCRNTRLPGLLQALTLIPLVNRGNWCELIDGQVNVVPTLRGRICAFWPALAIYSDLLLTVLPE